MTDLVAAYYGSGSDQWLKVVGVKETSGAELLQILKQTPGVETLVTESGQYAGWRLASQESYGAVSNVGSLVNSNTAGGVASVQSSGTIQVPGQFAESAGKVTVKSGATATGTKVLQFVSGEIVPATIAVATGLKLGYTIDKALYEKNPDIFKTLHLGEFNPDVMNDISLYLREEGLPIQEKLWNGLWGINPDDGTTQLYAEETQFAYTAGYLNSKGVFDSPIVKHDDIKTDPQVYVDGIYTYSSYKFKRDNTTWTDYEVSGAIQIPWMVEGYNIIHILVTSLTPTTYTLTAKGPSGTNVNTYDCNTPLETDIGTVYYGSGHSVFDAYDVPSPLTRLTQFIGEELIVKNYWNSNKTSSLTGTGTQPSATLPNVPNTNDIATIITALKQQYPELWDSAVTNDVLQPDGSIKTFTYLPLPTPTSKGKYDTQPTGDGSEQNQKDTDVKPDSSTEIQDSTTTIIVSPPTTPNPPDTGGGSSPTVVPPVGNASSLWSIYNPTLEQVNQFGSWLWSSNFVEQLKKLFNDPMQAIIGLHKVYSPVQTSGQGTIKCGYLDSGVPSKLVSEQYVTVDCGSVDLQEYFGNVFDYPPYTEVSIYLPFIGIQRLDPSDVMRSTISVKYHIDVLSGACMAEVNVQRDAAGGTLYTFTGDAAVRYPISSGSYMSMVSSIVSAVAGTAMIAVAPSTAGILGATAGVAHSFFNARNNVQHSGSFTGNAGAMGSKIPYLIISRPQMAMADQFETLSGYPSNTYTPLSACKGFTQVKYCHVENLNATDAEKQEIEQLLKEGVIL
jgi:hypothetical protein